MQESLSIFKKISEIIEALGIAFGAFFGGLGGFTAYSDWRNKNRKAKDYIDGLRKKYPRSMLNQNFQIVEKESMPGWLFLLDKDLKIKYWIKNPRALRDLGFSGPDKTTLSDSDFDKYPQGDAIVSKDDF